MTIGTAEENQQNAFCRVFCWKQAIAMSRIPEKSNHYKNIYFKKIKIVPPIYTHKLHLRNYGTKLMKKVGYLKWFRSPLEIFFQEFFHRPYLWKQKHLLSNSECAAKQSCIKTLWLTRCPPTNICLLFTTYEQRKMFAAQRFGLPSHARSCFMMTPLILKIKRLEMFLALILHFKISKNEDFKKLSF